MIFVDVNCSFVTALAKMDHFPQKNKFILKLYSIHDIVGVDIFCSKWVYIATYHFTFVMHIGDCSTCLLASVCAVYMFLCSIV